MQVPSVSVQKQNEISNNNNMIKCKKDTVCQIFVLKPYYKIIEKWWDRDTYLGM